jgi:hypothetical protein
MKSLNQKIKFMKKITAVVAFFSTFFMITPVTLKAQQAKVTVTIKSLKATSIDACNEKMDFYAKIQIDSKVKIFPVKEGNLLLEPGFQFTALTNMNTTFVRIEIWDEDDLACGGGDDKVCVGGTSNVINKTINIRMNRSDDFSSVGTCHESGTEKANISYNITIEPTKTGFLSQGTWHVVKKEIKRGSGLWEESTPPSPTCENDNIYEFHRTGAYEINEGATRCSPADPQIKNGNWGFLSGESRIRISLAGAGSPTSYTMDGVGENSLRLISSPTVIGGVLTYTRITYNH